MDIDKLAAAVRARREPLGLNVRFIREDGTPDEYSFRNKEQVDAFKAKLLRNGRKILP